MPDATSDYLNQPLRTLAEVEATRQVSCGSQPSIDGPTGKRMGWVYGVHIIRKMPADGRCPRCGLQLTK